MSQAPVPPAPPSAPPSQPQKGKGCFFYGCLGSLLLLLVVASSVGITYYLVTKGYRIPKITLTPQEKEIRDEKIEVLTEEPKEYPYAEKEETLPPEVLAKDETGEVYSNGVVFTAKEINSFFNDIPELKEKVFAELVEDGIRVKANFTIPDDAPLFAGKRFRGRVLVQTQKTDDRISLRINDVNISGFSVPNAWLFGLKDIDIIEEFFGDHELVNAFASGLEVFSITPEGIHIVPKD